MAAQFWRVVIVGLAGATVASLAFRFLPTWLAWCWALVAIGAEIVAAFILFILIYAKVAQTKDRKNLDKRLLLLPATMRQDLLNKYSRPSQDHILSIYVDMALDELARQP